MSNHQVAQEMCITLGISERGKQLLVELSIKHKLCYKVNSL